MYALDVDRLTVSYFDTHALDGVSVRLPVASLIGIIGPNGAGISTFLKAVLGLIPARIEQLRVLDQSLEAVRSRVAYVPQRSAIDWDFPVRVQDVVLMGCYPKLGLFKRPSKAQKAFAMECLERVGMSGHAERQIGELSGGQQQRVFLARALAQEAELLLLDEPFVGIDVASEQMIIELLRTLRAEGRTIVVVLDNGLRSWTIDADGGYATSPSVKLPAGQHTITAYFMPADPSHHQAAWLVDTFRVVRQASH